jgi:dienelactone hydrolase
MALILSALMTMKTSKRLIHSILLIGILLTSAASLRAQTPEMLSHFDYDRKAPIGLTEVGMEKRGNVTIHDITYVSPKGGTVPAYLVVPKGKGPFAAVVWGHWYWGNSPMRNRKEFLDEAVVLAGSGVISLLTDGPIARPGHVQNSEPLNEQQVTDMVQQVIDMRRGVDLLLARKDVDPTRIAYVGHSYNAVIGAYLSGVDRRFKAFVLMTATMSDEVTRKIPEYQEYRKQIGVEKFEAFEKKYYWTDQGKYVAHAAPAVVFLQYATQERFITPDRAREYAAVVSEPKRFKLYEAPHALNAEARRDRIDFLTERLKVRAVSSAALAAVPELFQPPITN